MVSTDTPFPFPNTESPPLHTPHPSGPITRDVTASLTPRPLGPGQREHQGLKRSTAVTSGNAKDVVDSYPQKTIETKGNAGTQRVVATLQIGNDIMSVRRPFLHTSKKVDTSYMRASHVRGVGIKKPVHTHASCALFCLRCSCDL